MNVRKEFLLIMLLGLLLVNTNAAPPVHPTATLKIVATTNILGEAVERIAGSNAEVTTLMGVGVDPHAYQPNTDAAAKIDSADIVFFIGRVEQGMISTLTSLESQGKAFSILHNMPPDQLLMLEGDYDPHIWNSPTMWKLAVGLIQDRLKAIDPTHSDDYDTNAATYLAEITAVDASAKTEFAQLPSDKRYLVSQHDAFNYFGREYNLTVKTIEGVSTTDQAGIEELNAIVDFIIAHKIQVIFEETTVTQSSSQAIIDSCADQGWTVVVGGVLYSGSLGNTADTDTYTEMISYNVHTVVSAILNPPEPSTEPAPITVWYILIAFPVMWAVRRKQEN